MFVFIIFIALLWISPRCSSRPVRVSLSLRIPKAQSLVGAAVRPEWETEAAQRHPSLSFASVLAVAMTTEDFRWAKMRKGYSMLFRSGCLCVFCVREGYGPMKRVSALQHFFLNFGNPTYMRKRRTYSWPNASYGFTFFIGPLWVSQLTKKKKKDFHSISIFVTAIVGSQHIFSAPFSGIFIKCSRCLLWFSVSAVFFLRCVPRLVTCWCCNWTRHIFLMD